MTDQQGGAVRLLHDVRVASIEDRLQVYPLLSPPVIGKILTTTWSHTFPCGWGITNYRTNFNFMDHVQRTSLLLTVELDVLYCLVHSRNHLQSSSFMAGRIFEFTSLSKLQLRCSMAARWWGGIDDDGNNSSWPAHPQGKAEAEKGERNWIWALQKHKRPGTSENKIIRKKGKLQVAARGERPGAIWNTPEFFPADWAWLIWIP